MNCIECGKESSLGDRVDLQLDFSETPRLDKWFHDPNLSIYDLGLRPRQSTAMQDPLASSNLNADSSRGARDRCDGN